MKPSNVQLNDIALFVEVAKRKSFSLAARALEIPTSTLSRRISELERAIGLRLINRNTRRLDLTDAGSVYLQRCQGLVEEARLAREQLMSLSGKPQGRLSISMPYSLAIWLLPETVQEFTDRYPDLECEFDLSMRQSDPSGAPYDVSLHFGRPAGLSADPADVVVRELFSLNNYLYATQEYLERHGAPQTPADLARHQCIRTTIDESHSYWTLYSGARSERVAVSGHVAGNNMSVMGTLSGLGLGITRMPECPALTPVITRNALKRVLPDWSLAPIPIYAVFPSRIIPAKTRAFMEFIHPKLDPSSLQRPAPIV